MADDKMLHEAIEAVANGHRERARDLLTRLLKADQTNPKYWLWMSSVVETTKERIYCLQKVLHLEPGNKAAQLGLLIQGARTAEVVLQSQPLIQRNWQKSYKTTSLDSSPRKVARFIMYTGAAVLVLGFIAIGFIGPRISRAGNFGSVRLTVTPIFETLAATATLLPTNTPRVVTPTPTFIGPTPLWMFLESTYTPTPLYVNTPHPATEAYRAGLRALKNRNYSEMIFFMEQASQAEPDQADIHFHLGEAYLLSDEPEKALFAYEKAIELNPNFAPAYLGRARALTTIDPDFDHESDLLQALVLDPNLIAAHLDLISFYLSQKQYDEALISLNELERVSPESPLFYAYRSQALMNTGDFEGAFEAAEQAYALDQTILDVYKVLGEVNVHSGDIDQAVYFLEIYLRYVKDDPDTWASYGQALFSSGERIDAAMEAFDLALTLDENSLTALLYRGYAYLELGEGQLAVNDLFIARNFDRESFSASFGLARALAISERYEDAISQFKGSEQLVETNLQLAEVYYWRAKTSVIIGEQKSAVQDFTALLSLPPDEIPVDWIEEAEKYLTEITPTPTMTSTPIPPTETATPSPTLTPRATGVTPSPTSTTSPTVTLTPTGPSPTPRAIRTTPPKQ